MPHQMVVGDGVATPPELASLFTERLLLLPNSYFLSDHPALYPRHQVPSSPLQGYLAHKKPGLPRTLK